MGWVPPGSPGSFGATRATDWTCSKRQTCQRTTRRATQPQPMAT